MTTSWMNRFGGLLAVVAGVCVLGGCSSTAPAFEVSTYPAGLGQQVLTEATVERSGVVMRVTNGSSMALGPGTMWVNQEFSHPVGVLDAGTAVDFDLSAFRNEFGERFRAGGFWATEKPKLLSLVQIKPDGNGGSLIGLVVVKDEPR
ncbi:MAG: hypothetical protein KDA20_03090 [Phycisphaerales bacterium]|nr:hypothetical protein [Phycisphaerales bacterium]